MQKTMGMAEAEKNFLIKLSEMEDLVEKKTKIYSRLLTDAALAEEMEALSLRHEKRKEALKALVYGKGKEERQGGGEEE